MESTILTLATAHTDHGKGKQSSANPRIVTMNFMNLRQLASTLLILIIK
jgi:hypothetical protein